MHFLKKLSLTGPESFDILQGHSRATVFLIMNNAAQGILSSFFFKYAGNTETTFVRFTKFYELVCSSVYTFLTYLEIVNFVIYIFSNLKGI